MSLIAETEKYLTEVVHHTGYDLDKVSLETSNKPEFGEYQINVAMQIAKKYGQNPREVAASIVENLDDRFINVNIQGPGFINVSFADKIILDYLNAGIDNFDIFIDQNADKRTIVLDYGGANIAKELHVGHLRCNIGEAIRRLLNVFGDKTISDIHWGDWGTPMGLVILEIEKMYPDLPYFDPDYEGEYPSTSPVTNDDLAIIYPRASLKKKEDPVYADEARLMTKRLQSGERGIRALWQHIVRISSDDCKKVYDYLNCHFDYSYGESDADKYVGDVLSLLKEKDVTEYSDGALIMHVADPDDKKAMPPLMLVKSDGAVLYDTTELATVYQRMHDWQPNAIWYFTDERQSLHFEQIFRGCYKSGLTDPDVDLHFYGFGTINGTDGKPFKTRDGGVMSLKNLIKEVYVNIEPKIKEDIVGDERIVIANKLTVATLKFADLLPYRKTDYIFDVEKFTSFEGKTGIYAVYTATRLKSLLKKVGNSGTTMTSIVNSDMREILVKLTELSRVLKNAYCEITTNYIAEFIYELCSLYNKFYAKNNISNETSIAVKNSYIALSRLVYNTLSKLLDILGIEEVDRM